MKQNSLSLQGKFHIKVVRDGKIINSQSGKNLVVDTGLEYALERLSQISSLVVNVMAIGSGSAGVLPTDITLETETASTRTIASSSQVLLNQLTLVFNMTSPGSSTMREIGVFNTITPPGILFARFLTQEVDLVNLDVIGLTYILQSTGSN